MLRSLVLFGLAAFAGASIKDCNPASVFRPTALALYPDPPVRGEPVYMTVKFENPGAEVTDGKVTTAITLNGLPLSPIVKALCDDTACPITSGVNDRSTSSVWPDSVTGRVASKITWTGSRGESLLCIQTNVAVNAFGNTTMAIVERTFGDDKHQHPAPHHSDGPKPAPPPPPSPHHSDGPKPAPHHSDKPYPKPHHSDGPNPIPKPHHSDKPKLHPKPHRPVKPKHTVEPSPSSAHIPPIAGTTSSGTTSSGTTGSGTTSSGTTGSGTTSSGTTGQGITSSGTTGAGSTTTGGGPTININIQTIINGVLRRAMTGTTSSGGSTSSGGTTSSDTTSSGTTSSGSTHYLRH